MPTTVFLPSARRDLAQIDPYLRGISDRLAESFVNEVQRTADFYALFPLLGSPLVIDGATVADVRWGKVKKYRKYLLMYRPVPDGVHVVRVIYGQQNLADVLAGNV